MPEIVYETEEAIPEGLREGFKTTDDGKFIINVVPKAKVDEFRENNVALAKERDELKVLAESLNKLVGENPDEFAAELEALRDIKQQVDDGKLKPGVDVQKAVDERVAALKTGLETQLAEKAKEVDLQKARGDSFETKFKASVVDTTIAGAVLSKESGLNPDALPDILTRGRKIFVVDDDGKLVPKDGETIIYGADGATPMTPLEWVTKLRDDAPHLALNSTGGNAGGGEKKNFHGHTEEEFSKLPARKRLELANKAAA